MSAPETTVLKIRGSASGKCSKCLAKMMTEPKVEENESNAMLMGTFIHDGFVAWYSKKIGMRIQDREKEIENDTFTGHIDGYIPKERAIFELKTVNGYKFGAIDDVLQEHLAQINVYMHIMGVDMAHYVYLNRDTGEYKQFYLQYNALIYKATEEKAKRVIEAVRNGATPDDIDVDEFELCDQYCEFDRAPIYPKPDGEMTSEALSSEEREELLKLTQEYQEAKAQEDEAKMLKAQANERVKEIMATHKAKKLTDLKLTFVETNRETFDSKAFKADDPNTYSKYTKSSVSQYILFPKAV